MVVNDKKWIDWLVRLQSLAQAGLAYSRDKYDIERFEEIREISVSIMAELSQVPAQKVADLFANETGYQSLKLIHAQPFFKMTRFY